MVNITTPHQVFEKKYKKLFTDDEFNNIKRHIDNGMVNTFNEFIDGKTNKGLSGLCFKMDLKLDFTDYKPIMEKFELDLNKERVTKYITRVMNDSDWVIYRDIMDEIISTHDAYGCVTMKIKFYIKPVIHNEFTLLKRLFLLGIKKVKMLCRKSI